MLEQIHIPLKLSFIKLQNIQFEQKSYFEFLDISSWSLSLATIIPILVSSIQIINWMTLYFNSLFMEFPHFSASPSYIF